MSSAIEATPKLLRRFPLPERLSTEQARAVADRMVYSVETVTGIELRLEPLELVVTLTDPADLPALEKLIDALVEEAMTSRVRGGRILRQHNRSDAGSSTHNADPVDASEWALLHHAYDRVFREMSREFSARDRKYSPLIDLSVMDLCNYLQLFPQNAYLVDEFPHQRDALVRMRQGTGSADGIRRSSQFMLNPALCFHMYGEFAGRVISEPAVVTMSGECFRHEAGWRLNRYRKPSFTMREIAFMGENSSVVEDLRTRLMDRTWRLFVELGFSGRIETAADPFYYVEDSAMRQHQLLANTKYELIYEGTDGVMSAIASFNNVGESLCGQFGIANASGRAAHSGCAAFGIDRWVEATLSVHGRDRRQWPEVLVRHCL